MVLTRSASSSPVKKSAQAIRQPSSASANTTANAPKLEQGEPLKVVILPRAVSSDARFISLSNPVDQDAKSYLFCPDTGLCELRRTCASKHDPRSILFTPQDTEHPRKRTSNAVSNGYVNKKAEYLTATPYDICFMLLPLLTSSTKSNLFQTLDDILEDASLETHDLPYIMQKSRPLIEEGISRVCDSVSAGDETLYRYSESKTLQLLIAKSKRACENGLPASLEERFVTRFLEAPMLSVKRDESTISVAKEDSQDSIADQGTPSESFDSQSTIASTAPSMVFSETSTTSTATSTTTSTVTVVPEVRANGPSSEIVVLQRILTAFKYIVHSYLPPSLASTLLITLRESCSGIDFTPLTLYLAHLDKIRAEAAASLDLSSFSRKRGIEDNFEAEERAEKKKRLEEEEKRKKASMSRGVKDLAKVDVKGMKKMSSFFTKMPTKTKS